MIEAARSAVDRAGAEMRFESKGAAFHARLRQAFLEIAAREPERCVVIDIAPQTGVRQTRMLEGEYVITKEDLMERKRFPDAVARGRDYTTPYRAIVPKGVDNLLVAGRHYSATSSAQKMSREIPPCMAMGEAAGVAAALALDAGVKVRDVDVKRLCTSDAAPPSRRSYPPPAFPAAPDVIEVPVAEQEVLPLLTVLPLQLLAYYMADLKGTDVDQPRNLAKTVTVE